MNIDEVFYDQNTNIEKLKRKWKNTKEYRFGILYVNKLISIKEYGLAKKVILELKKYSAHQIELLTILGNVELYMGNIEKAKYNLERIGDIGFLNSAFISLARSYFVEGNIEKAREILNKGLEHKEKCYALVELINFDIHEKKYEDAFLKLRKLKSLIYLNVELKSVYNNLALIVAKNLNLIPEIYELDNRYLEKQICDYDESLALQHILIHTKENIFNKKIHTLFSENIDVKKLFEEVYNMLDDNTYAYTATTDIHYLYYPGIGENEDYLLVSTLPGTNKITNMYPSKYGIVKLKKERCK